MQYSQFSTDEIARLIGFIVARTCLHTLPPPPNPTPKIKVFCTKYKGGVLEWYMGVLE